MGKDFNFKKWCDQWLLTSGVNILEPIVQYGPNDQIKSLSINQKFEQNKEGLNRLRQQKIDVALYDENYKPHIIKDVVLSDKIQLTSVKVDFKGPVKAILLNYGDHGYTKVQFDRKSMTNLERNLFKIEDAFERAQIWSQAWYTVIDFKFTSIQLLRFHLHQVPLETNEGNLRVGIKNLMQLSSFLIPLESKNLYDKQIFNCLMKTLANKEIPKDAKSIIASQINRFMIANKELEELGQSWFENGFIHPKFQPTINIFDLSDKQKESLASTLCYSEYITTAQKNYNIEKVLKGDQSDTSEELKFKCLASIPDAKMKQQVWNDFTNPESKLSLRLKQSLMESFYTPSQKDMLKPYYLQYFSSMISMYKQNTYPFFKDYFRDLLPSRNDINTEDINKLENTMQVYLQSDDGKKAGKNDGFVKILQDGIDTLKRSKKFREYAVDHKED